MLRGVPLRQETKRKQDTAAFWEKVIEDFNNKVPVSEIRKRYINPATQKHYTIRHIYWILRKHGVL